MYDEIRRTRKTERKGRDGKRFVCVVGKKIFPEFDRVCSTFGLLDCAISSSSSDYFSKETNAASVM